MVIDGDRRIKGSGHPAAGYNRIAAGLHNLGLRPQVREDLPREVRHAPDVGSLGRIHANRRNLHHLTKQIFKPAADLCHIVPSCRSFTIIAVLQKTTADYTDCAVAAKEIVPPAGFIMASANGDGKNGRMAPSI